MPPMPSKASTRALIVKCLTRTPKRRALHTRTRSNAPSTQPMPIVYTFDPYTVGLPILHPGRSCLTRSLRLVQAPHSFPPCILPPFCRIWIFVSLKPEAKPIYVALSRCQPFERPLELMLTGRVVNQ